MRGVLCVVTGAEPNSPPQLRRGQRRRSRGWGGAVQENLSLDQHHPGASRHPSSSEEGILLFVVRISRQTLLLSPEPFSRQCRAQQHEQKRHIPKFLLLDER